ncbi:arylesterase [Shewanella insulae]|uniref:Arylesterase n=1 Tax=Shewanella insulae TaxID=2681496 RepID=A0A6L7HXQ8_9GAMM|nr:arylesterase [Shewanella insulae]MXR69107.1 arylesterase [Shewanella insulae]
MQAACLLALFLIPQAHANPILILGDSLSASYGMEQDKGWVHLLQQQAPETTIINGSVSGETSAGGLRRLPALLDSTKAKLVFIELGGNDGLRGFSPKQLKNNLTKMIQLAKDAGAEVLLSEVMVPPNYGPRYAKQFTQVYQELSSEHGVTLVPFFMTEIAIHPELMQADGIHPNELAQPQIVDFIRPWLIDTLQESE